MNKMQLRPFNPDDAETILGWCKDKHAFRLWSADRSCILSQLLLTISSLGISF